MSESVTSRTAEISWEDGALPNPVNPEIMEYSVYLNGSLAVTVTVRNAALDGLLPFVIYSVTVIARNRIGDSLMSESHIFSTLEEGMLVFQILLYCWTLHVLQV